MITREEVMAPFRMLAERTLRHTSGVSLSLNQNAGRDPDLAVEDENHIHSLIGVLRAALPEDWKVLSHGKVPVRRPEPEPEDATPESYHARLDACVKALADQGVEGAACVYDVPAGWVRIMEEVSAALTARKARDPEAALTITQVKEKFGTLRFYIQASGSEAFVEDAYDLAEWAEAASEGRCCVTGKPGAIDNAGWVLTLCPEAAEMRKASPTEFRDRIYPPRPADLDIPLGM